jgi:SNF2 family DNA or RNA helicase
MLAHFIGRRSTIRSRAVCSLQATSRWVVSGTPVQNRLTDLGTLVHFLRLYPFDDPSFFDKEFLRPWKTRSDPTALERLRALVRFVTIRRSKEVLDLMPREDYVERLHFNSSEQELYDSVKSRTRDALPELLGPHGAAKPNVFNVLVWIDNLRKTCNHGLINERSLVSPIRKVLPLSDSYGGTNTDVEDGELSGNVPIEGSSGLDLLDYVSQQLQEASLQHADMRSQALIVSDMLAAPVNRDHLQVSWDSHSPGAMSPKSSGGSSPDRVSATATSMPIPTKIERLVQDLMNDESNEKR